MAIVFISVSVSLGDSFCTGEIISVETVGVMQNLANAASPRSFPMLSSWQWLEFVLEQGSLFGMLNLFKVNWLDGDWLTRSKTDVFEELSVSGSSVVNWYLGGDWYPRASSDWYPVGD